MMKSKVGGQKTGLLVGGLSCGLSGELMDKQVNPKMVSLALFLEQKKVIEGGGTMLNNKKHCKGAAHATRRRECLRRWCFYLDENQQCSA